MKKIIERIRTASSLAVLLAFGAGNAWGDFTKQNPVTGETESYTWKFTGDTVWNNTDYWENSDGSHPTKVPARYYSEEEGGNTFWDPILFDGNTININASMTVAGWNLRMGVYNGARIALNSFKKYQGDTTMWVTVDALSQFTVAQFSGDNLAGNQVIKFSTVKAGGIKWTDNLVTRGADENTFEYYLGSEGCVSYAAISAGAHTIKQADFTLDSANSGSGYYKVSKKPLVTFTSSTKTFTADATVKNTTDDTSTTISTVKTVQTLLPVAGQLGYSEIVQTSTGVYLYYVDYSATAPAAAGTIKEYKNTGSTYTIEGGYAGSDSITMTIPVSPEFPSGTLVKITDIKLASRNSTFNPSSYDATYIGVSGDGLPETYSGRISGYSGTMKRDATTDCNALQYTFHENGSLLVRVDTPYTIKFYNANGDEMTGGYFLVKSSLSGEVFYTTSTLENDGWRIIYEVSATSVSSATVSANGDFSGLTFDSAPADWSAASSVPVCLNVTESATLNLGSSVSLESLTINIASGKTLSLTGTSLATANGIVVAGGGNLTTEILSATSSDTVDLTIASSSTLNLASSITIDRLNLYIPSGNVLTLTGTAPTVASGIFIEGGGAFTPQVAISSKVNIGSGITVNANSGSTIYASNFAGSGTIVFDGVRPSTSENDAVTTSALSESWTGTLWFKNYNNTTAKQLFPEYWGKKIKWTNVAGYLPNQKTLESEWILENGSNGYAFRRTDGFSNENKLVVAKLSGSGTFDEYNSTTQIFCFLDVSEFTGTINRCSEACKARISLGTSEYVAEQGGVLIYNCTCPAKITGPMSVKVDGGTVTLSGQSTFTADMKVCASTTAQAGADGYGGDGNYGPFGPKVTASSVASTTRRVEVQNGGTIDINGHPEMRYFFKLAGDGVNGAGALINTGSAVGNGKANVSGIELAADASIGGTQNFGIIAGGFNQTVYDLAGHTLVKKGDNTVYVVNGTKKEGSTQGTIRVDAGTLDINTGSNNSKATDLDDTAIEVTGGTLAVNTGFTFGRLNQTGGTISIAADKTATASDTSDAAINLATLSGAGTLDLSASTATTLNIAAGEARSAGFTGTINYPSTLTTVNIALTEASSESGTITYDQSSWGFGAGVTVNYQVTLQAGPTVTGTYSDGTVTYARPMAAIGTVGYDTLADAIADAAENATVTLLGNSSEAITLDKTINFVENGTFSGTFTGTGKIILPQDVVAFKNGSASMWPDGWTGKVELPSFAPTATTEIAFNKLGNGKSTVVLKGIYPYSGALNSVRPAEIGSVVNPTVQIDGPVYFTAGSSAGTTFSKVTGTAHFCFDSVDSTAFKWHISELVDFNGTIGAYVDSNVQVELTIGTVSLSSADNLPVGSRIVGINTEWTNYDWSGIVDVGDTVVTIGGGPTAYKLVKKTGGLFVAAVASVTPTGGSATECATLADATELLNGGAGTVALLVDTDEDITLMAGQRFEVNGKTYGGTPSGATGTIEFIDAGIQYGVYVAVDNSSNTWISTAPSGNWNTPTCWVNGVVPKSYTAVTFPEGTFTVRISTNHTSAESTRDKCGSLTVNGDVNFAPVSTTWVELMLSGDVSGTGTLTLNQKTGLYKETGSEFVIGCNFVGDAGDAGNCFVGGKPMRFTKPVTIKGTNGGYFKNEAQTAFFEDTVTIKKDAKIYANGAAITFGTTFTLGSGASFVATDADIILDDADLDDVIEVTGGNVIVGNGGEATLTIGNDGYLKVGSATGEKWLTCLTRSGSSEDNAINLRAGGVLEVCVITFDDNSSPCPTAVNFDGGTLKTYKSTSDIYQQRKLIHDTGIAVNVLAGGANIEIPASKTANIAPVITSGVVGGTDGGLTKKGDGTLIVEEVPTYTGPTKVEAGVLYIKSAESYAFTLDADTAETTSDKGGYRKFIPKTPVTVDTPIFEVYYADYSKAQTVTLAVSDYLEGSEYTLQVGSGTAVAGTYANGTVTFTDVTGFTPGAAVNYTITVSGTATGSKSGSVTAAAATATGWVNETKTTIGTQSATGTWAPSVLVFGEADSATLSGETTFTANSQASGKVTLTTVVNFGNEADPTLEISADAKAAIKVEDSSFKVWTKTTAAGVKGDNAAWLTVSGATPDLEHDSTVVFTFDTTNQTYTVSVGENALHYGENAANTTFAFASDGVAISSVAYKGAGSFTSLTGEYTTTDIAETVDGKGVVVANSFISGNAELSAMTVEQARTALAPDSSATCSNGYNYFTNYALGLEPTEEEDKPEVRVTTDANGKFVITLTDKDGNVLDVADNVAVTLSVKTGTNPEAVTGEGSEGEIVAGEGTGEDQSFVIDPTKVESVKYYKVQINIGAK